MKLLNAAILILLLQIMVFAQEKADMVVAQDGSGNYTTIQAAINAVPSDNTGWITILVKDGIYNEHLFIGNSYIALVGESRANTRIQFELDRDVWYKAHGSTNVGSGVITIGVSQTDSVTEVAATNILIGNMTIENTFTNHLKYTHVIRGESGCNNVMVVYCDVLCIGKDTHALWNKLTGMYYQSNNRYTGYVDAVCPRGWSYDVESEFVELYGASPLWHEGNVTGQKFVVRNAQILPGSNEFDLFNGQGTSILYLLDSYLSSKVSSQGGSTVYYYNTHKESGDESWHQDNLSSATGAPSNNEITAAWTFNNLWDPENQMPSALPFAAIPQPWNKAVGLSGSTTLKWIKGRNYDTCAVYFGTTSTPPLVRLQTERTYTPATLSAGTYYWRVDMLSGTDTVKGTVWSFTVGNTVSVRNNVPSAVALSTSAMVSQNADRTLSISLPFTESSATAVIALYDMRGSRVYSQSVNEHDTRIVLSNLSTGMYTLQIRLGAQTMHEKILLR